jgi:hypothetical protein
MLPEMKTGSQLFDPEENPYFQMVAGVRNVPKVPFRVKLER